MLPKILVYLSGLYLTEKASSRKRDDYLEAPPPKKSKAIPRIRFGKVTTGGVWGNLHANEDEKDNNNKEVPPINLTEYDNEYEELKNGSKVGGHKILW